MPAVSKGKGPQARSGVGGAAGGTTNGNSPSPRAHPYPPPPTQQQHNQLNGRQSGPNDQRAFNAQAGGGGGARTTRERSTSSAASDSKEPANAKRHLSCENCRMRKMRCSRQSPCLSCRMRGDECIWVGTPPGGVAEEDELKSTNDEIERLKKLVDLLLERLEEQNEAEEQQALMQAQAQGQGQDNGQVTAAGVAVPAAGASTNPYQAHFAMAPSTAGASDIQIYSPVGTGGGGVGVGSKNGPHVYGTSMSSTGPGDGRQ
ncbi:hypothetical protein JCM10908_005111 [Rhodotorula pacifica]|uniref:Zn(II)2Cys6 transcription factor domain-containing protein n=1 Tax=Rhodotorula pacifica TaxID=1495444 RepID=UPI00317EECFA